MLGALARFLLVHTTPNASDFRPALATRGSNTTPKFEASILVVIPQIFTSPRKICLGIMFKEVLTRLGDYPFLIHFKQTSIGKYLGVVYDY